MLKSLFSKNPLLKVLLPLLLICVLAVLFIQQIKPQLALREELEAEAAALNQQLNQISKMASSLSANDKGQMEEELKTMRDNLGLGLYSPEIVQHIEERAQQARIQIYKYTFEETAETDGLQERKLTLGVRGRFTAILDFQKKLEDFPPFKGSAALLIRPVQGGAGGELEGDLTVSFSCVPEELAKIDSSNLPMREYPFRY